MINQETMEYLLRRQIELIKDQHHFEALQAQHGTDEETILYSTAELARLVHETIARRAELALLITCNTITDEHKAMTARDEETAARQRKAMKAMIDDNEKARISDFMKLGFKDIQAHATFTPKK